MNPARNSGGKLAVWHSSAQQACAWQNRPAEMRQGAVASDVAHRQNSRLGLGRFKVGCGGGVSVNVWGWAKGGCVEGVVGAGWGKWGCGVWGSGEGGVGCKCSVGGV